MNHKENPLGTAPVGRLLLQYAIPTIISTLMASLYNMVDQMFIGQRIGFLGNAATTVAYPLTFLCGALTLLFSNGSAVNFNVSNGRRKKEEALHFAGAGLTLLTAEGLFTTALVLLFTPFIVNLFGATQEVYPYALTYMRLIAPGFPFLALTSGGTLLIRSDGSPRYALVCSMAGVVLNFILDYLFLFPLNMGIAGAAIATVLGQVASAILVVVYLLRFKTGKLLRHHFAVTGSKITQIMSRSGGQPQPGGHAGHEPGPQQLPEPLRRPVRIRRERSTGSRRSRHKGQFSLLLHHHRLQHRRTADHGIQLGSSAGGYEAFALRYMHEFMLLVILAGVLPVSMNAMVSIKKPINGIIISLSKQLVLIVLLLILPRFMGIDGVLITGPAADFLVAVAAFTVVRRAFRQLGERG